MTEQAEATLKRLNNYQEARADFLIDFIRLGMDWQTALVAAELTSEDGEALLEDKSFRDRLNYYVAKREAELLKALDTAAHAAATAKGDVKGIERLLEILKPEKYSKKASLSLSSSPISTDETDKGFVIAFKKADKPSEQANKKTE